MTMCVINGCMREWSVLIEYQVGESGSKREQRLCGQCAEAAKFGSTLEEWDEKKNRRQKIKIP